MSIDAHPNLHAVKLTVELCKIVFGEHRLPEESEVLIAYANSLRGKAKAEYEIQIVGMIENLRVLLEVGFRQIKDGREEEGVDSLKRFIGSFVCEVSERLDEVCSQVA